jgi:L-ascorbate metabolism protein UlaG (beta-lactamase superfamily)
MPDVQLTWLGHATFRFDTPGGKRVYVDPWLTNPKIPDSEKEPERVDLIALTHGHDDHVGQTVELVESTTRSSWRRSSSPTGSPG